MTHESPAPGAADSDPADEREDEGLDGASGSVVLKSVAALILLFIFFGIAFVLSTAFDWRWTFRAFHNHGTPTDEFIVLLIIVVTVPALVIGHRWWLTTLPRRFGSPVIDPPEIDANDPDESETSRPSGSFDP